MPFARGHEGGAASCGSGKEGCHFEETLFQIALNMEFQVQNL